jgi:cytochrome c oxidase subunit 4
MSSHAAPSLRVYLGVFGALLVLTGVTTAVAFLELGAWNTVVALVIAAAKAALVALVFMHLRWSSRLVWIFAGGALFWLAALIVLILSDYQTRVPVPGW